MLFGTETQVEPGVLVPTTVTDRADSLEHRAFRRAGCLGGSPT